ncbi:unnamed protein product [Darwinula stevensoni]|uniref:FXNA-like protease n=1 Tax=Darwinula stevensoni TaxID=69355 RepID=A0A7R8X158_9CRUS|nr:unnamed protein product [Darwinula stevensoni]CAG0879849.1 unnamed protein product [Darwinula stevensoni]
MRGADEAHIRHRLRSPRAPDTQQNDMGPYSHEKLKYSDSPSYYILSLLFIYSSCIIFAIFAADSNFPTPKNISNQNLKDGVFIEERARTKLVHLASFGPKPTGSYENEVLAVDFLKRTLIDIKYRAHSSHNITVEVQQVSGSFPLDFKERMTSIYAHLQNVIAVLEPREKPSHDAMLVNCHFDTVPWSPGAGDDLASCAVMLEVFEVLATSSKPLKNSIIFLFNGGEENFLQASHGFITQHPWASRIKAVVNLDACGAGGRELVFQAGPNSSWLVETYAGSVPHPFASSVAQDIFESGVIPGETDFRIFRDFGRIPGLDIANIHNGYVYHTSNDIPEHITPKSLQRAGNNILALVKAIGNSDTLQDQQGPDKSQKMVYFDFLGLFMVVYSINWAYLLCIGGLALMTFTFFNDMKASNLSRIQYVLQVLLADAILIVAYLGSKTITLVMGILLDLFGCSMSWYSRPILIWPLYIFPSLGFSIFILRSFSFLHSKDIPKNSTLMGIYLHASNFLWSALLLLLVFLELRSSYIPTLFIIFPSLFSIIRSPRWSTIQNLTMYLLLHAIPAICFLSICLNGFVLFVPIAGRMSATLNPEIIITILTSITVSAFVLHLMPVLQHVDGALVRKIGIGLTCCGLVTMILVLLTPLGFPYSADLAHPSQQRFIIIHSQRKWHDLMGGLKNQDAGYWLLHLDRHNPDSMMNILPGMHTAQHLSRQECFEKLSCGMPYYFPSYNVLRTWTWLPASDPVIHDPIKMKPVSKEVISRSPLLVNWTFHVSGPDHMTMVLSPEEGIHIQNWSFPDPPYPSTIEYKRRPTYFLYYSWGAKRHPLTFSLTLKISTKSSTLPENFRGFVYLEEREEDLKRKEVDEVELVESSLHVGSRGQRDGWSIGDQEGQHDTLIVLRFLIPSRRIGASLGVPRGSLAQVVHVPLSATLRRLFWGPTRECLIRGCSAAPTTTSSRFITHVQERESRMPPRPEERRWQVTPSLAFPGLASPHSSGVPMSLRVLQRGEGGSGESELRLVTARWGDSRVDVIFFDAHNLLSRSPLQVLLHRK